jgi:hypothetical protein
VDCHMSIANAIIWQTGGSTESQSITTERHERVEPARERQPQHERQPQDS